MSTAINVDLAAMRSVETMLGAYLGPDEAERAANDVIARLRIGGFDIVRHAARPVGEPVDGPPDRVRLHGGSDKRSRQIGSDDE